MRRSENSIHGSRQFLDDIEAYSVLGCDVTDGSNNGTKEECAACDVTICLLVGFKDGGICEHTFLYHLLWS